MRVGLRFDRNQTRTLRELADRAARAELGISAVEIFSKAADAAASGEPLVVEARDMAEVQLLANGYVQYGVRPGIEELSDRYFQGAR